MKERERARFSIVNDALRYVGLMRSLFLIKPPPFKWYMARIVTENGHKRDTCCVETGRCVQDINTIWASSVYTFGKCLCDHLEKKEDRRFHFLYA